MIPKNISRSHILSAIQEIDRNGFPKRRQSKKYQLELAGRHYPPKYVIALANKFANGEFLKSSEFGGGTETNNFLRQLGFTIIDKKTTIPNKPAIKTEKTSRSRKRSQGRHTERCPKCKETVEALLEKIFGSVTSNYRFEMGVLAEDFSDNDQYQALQKIQTALQNLRGHQQFVRTNNLPRVDYYVPDPGFIVEYDESQHFTASRKITLEHYPESLKVGFEVGKWIKLCDHIQASDNRPAFRDEQRAWYDTLRDFLPAIKGLKPTIRLYADDYQWCSLNPEKERDRDYFKALIFGKTPEIRIEVIDDPSPDLARIVIAGKWEGILNQAESILHKVCRYWPESKRVDCLITCGAFITFSWPSSLPKIEDNKYPNQKAIDQLISAAETETRKLLNTELREKLLQHTNYLTIGADSKKDQVSLSSALIREPHIELVALVDLRKNRYYWTGKSYPTTGQQEGLIRIRDHQSHFLELPFGKVIILGCHDLSIFNKRGQAVTKAPWRKEIRRDFYKLIKEKQPEIVLHHPHTTDTPRTWKAAWNELTKTASSIKKYLGSGIYYREKGQRAPIEEVLSSTKQGQTIDFIVYL